VNEINNALISTPIAANAATETPAGTPATVADLVARLRELRQLIPQFNLLPLKDRRSISPVANIDPAFVTATINASGVSPTVEIMLGRTQPELRQEADEAEHWTALEEECRAMWEGVATGNKVRRHRIGQAALDTYAIARRLAKRPEHAALLPHVATMKRLGRFPRSKAKAPEPAPPLVTVTATEVK
jgi:hypothetical protein